METYTIGEVAERSGFTASALRFYERHRIVEPVARTEAGYRLYDDTSVARLQFVARSTQLGCTLEEITALLRAWEREHCGPVQLRLHELAAAEIADARTRSDGLLQLAADVASAAEHLGGAPLDGPCGGSCACVTAATPTAHPRRLTIDRSGIALEGRAPEAAGDVVATLFEST